MEASPHRVEPECPYFGRCGGCVFWHMDYACELEQKKRRVQDALSRIGGVEFPDLQITGSESMYGYRNKVQFPVQTQNGKPVAGFYRAGSHAVIAIADCKIQPESANRAREAVLRWMEKKILRRMTSGRTQAWSGISICARQARTRRFCFA